MPLLSVEDRPTFFPERSSNVRGCSSGRRSTLFSVIIIVCDEWERYLPTCRTKFQHLRNFILVSILAGCRTLFRHQQFASPRIAYSYISARTHLIGYVCLTNIDRIGLAAVAKPP